MEILNEMGSLLVCPAIAFLRGDRMLIGLRHYTPDKWKTISAWTIPGGRCDEGEHIEETLRREVAEETGIKKFSITDFLGKVPGAKEGDVVYLFKGITDGEPKLMEPEKFSEWKWESIDSLPEGYINPAQIPLVRDSLKKKMNHE